MEIYPCPLPQTVMCESIFASLHQKKILEVTALSILSKATESLNPHSNKLSRVVITLNCQKTTRFENQIVSENLFRLAETLLSLILVRDYKKVANR